MYAMNVMCVMYVRDVCDLRDGAPVLHVCVVICICCHMDVACACCIIVLWYLLRTFTLYIWASYIRCVELLHLCGVLEGAMYYTFVLYECVV
jgi:hypothetical protein